MASLDDAVNTVFNFMEQDNSNIQDAQSYLESVIPSPPHLKSVIHGVHQDYKDYHYDVSTADTSNRG